METITRSGLLRVSDIISEAQQRGMVGLYSLSWSISSVLESGERTYTATISW